jgi:TolA-binding protein
MKKKMNLTIIAIGFLFIFVGCLKTRTDVKEVEESKLLQSQVSSMQKANADYVSRVEETLENYRALSGRVDELENKLEKSVGTDSEKQTVSTKATIELNEKIKLLQDSISKLQEEHQALQNEFLLLKNKTAKPEVTNNSNNTDSSAAVFSTAEDLFKQKKWKEAILQYDEYKKKSPKGKSIPEAIYKTGVCFQELNMKDEAKVFYQELLSKFPKSEFARKAQTRLKSI